MQQLTVLFALLLTLPALAPTASATQEKATLVTGYHGVSRALAADDLKRGQDAAKWLADFATASGKTAKGEPKAILQRLATAATSLQKAADFPAARLAFGELSRETISLLVQKAEMAKGQQAYTCPMAKGYKKWLQPTGEEMANPYMGKRMLKCGMKTELRP